MATEKIVQYTPEQTEQVVFAYVTEGKTVEDIATAVGKSVRSVVAKLSREGVYKAKVKARVGRGLTKSQMIDSMASTLGVPAEQLESLEKASKEALEAVLEALAAK